MPLACRLLLEPLPQPRPRARAFEVGGRVLAQVYRPSGGRERRWRAVAVLFLRRVGQGHRLPLEGPLELKVTFVHARPKSTERKRAPRRREWHGKVGDLDNLLKSLMDAMKEAGWYRDDGQVARIVAEKMVGAQGESPSVSVLLDQLVPLEDSGP